MCHENFFESCCLRHHYNIIRSKPIGIMIKHGSGESSVYMKMNSGFNINLIIACEIEPRVLIHTVISAHVWSVDEASSYHKCDYLQGICEGYAYTPVCFR